MERRDDESVAVVSGPEDRSGWPDSKPSGGWLAADCIRERNADKDPDIEFAFISDVVEEVRQERHDRQQRSEAADRR